MGLGLHLFALLLAHQRNGDLDKVPGDGIHIPAHIAHFGEFGRLDLEEGRARELGETAGDLGLAHARRADHQDVLRRDLFAQPLGQVLATPAVSQRNGDRFLGVALADDVAIELMDDFARRKLSHDAPCLFVDWVVRIEDM